MMSPRRKMRYADRIRGIPVDDDGDTAAAGGANDDLGLTPDEWAEAARQMEDEATLARDTTAAETTAEEATGADDGATEGDGTDESHGEPENVEPPDTSYVDAFGPQNVEPENEPEISGRDQKYREQLREAEADRDQLRGLLESARRAEIERLASPRLADPRDLWYRDPSLADMLDEDGNVDPVKVDGAVTGLLEQHAHWGAPRAAYRGELRSGASERPVEPTAPRWSDAFAPTVE